MVQDFVQAAYRWVLGFGEIARELLPWISILLLGGLATWLAYRKVDPEGQTAFGPKLKGLGASVGRVALLVLATCILCGTLVQARKMVESRRETMQLASASRRREPNLSGVNQFAPVVAVIEDKTYTRSLTLPPDFATRVGAEGLQVLSPYLQDPNAENVTKLVDSFKRSGQDVIFTRELTRRDEVPVPADSADIKMRFRDEGAPSGRRHYEAEFTGDYRFRNPREAAAPMRFSFDLPQGGGTVQEFFIDVKGIKITEPDERGQYSWQGDVAAGEQVAAHVHYRVTGAAEYDYRLGSERRRIGKFNFVSESTQPPIFAKSGIYPTATSGSRAEWRLNDVLTQQSIALVFPRADLQSQLLDKSMAMLPLALALFALAALWLTPARALGATSAFALGLIGVPVLSAYLPPLAATLLGVLIAALAGGAVLRTPKGWPAAIVAAALPAVFITVEHGALLAWLLVLLVMAFVVLGRPRAIRTA